jgi:hypothetical protein
MADPRTEAERLVATALAALSMATRSTEGFATGSTECCVCPVCKAIAAARDPSPEFAERLATGAGDLATGVASVLKAFGGASNETGKTEAPKTEAPKTEAPKTEAPPKTPGEAPRESGDVWHDATN